MHIHSRKENYLKFLFNKISPDKISFSFTWDDNFERHINIIAPAFEQQGIRCTFYVNPGETDFINHLGSKYKLISENGHEIGSHGFIHGHYSNLSLDEFLFMLVQSNISIQKHIGKIPTTFAFPHHDYNENMLIKAREIYFETRNTLTNTKRVSLKSFTTPHEIEKAVKLAIEKKYSLVFSGHSISTVHDSKAEGYEPISVENLNIFIAITSAYSAYSDICTFEQAVLKEYIINHCTYNKREFYIEDVQLHHLAQFGLNIERIQTII